MIHRRLTFLVVWSVLLSIATSGCLVKTSDPGASRSNLNQETASRIIPGETTREAVLLTKGDFLAVLIRHVEGDGHREYVEGYHDVVSWPGSGASPPLSLVAAEDLKTRVFVLKTNDDRYVRCEGVETFDEPKRLSFLSYQDAVRFLKWLNKTKSLKVDRYDLLLDKAPLKAREIPELRVRPDRLNYSQK